VRIFKNKDFHKWAKKNGFSDLMLINMVHELEEGIFEANLGGGIYKKRIPMKGQGKRGGGRSIIAFKIGMLAIFLYAFAKNRLANISLAEEVALKKLAKIYFNLDDNGLDKAVKIGDLFEVHYEKNDS
jgi:hypothetical protein